MLQYLISKTDSNIEMILPKLYGWVVLMVLFFFSLLEILLRLEWIWEESPAFFGIQRVLGKIAVMSLSKKAFVDLCKFIFILMFMNIFSGR